MFGAYGVFTISNGIDTVIAKNMLTQGFFARYSKSEAFDNSEGISVRKAAISVGRSNRARNPMRPMLFDPMGDLFGYESTVYAVNDNVTTESAGLRKATMSVSISDAIPDPINEIGVRLTTAAKSGAYSINGLDASVALPSPISKLPGVPLVITYELFISTPVASVMFPAVDLGLVTTSIDVIPIRVNNNAAWAHDRVISGTSGTGQVSNELALPRTLKATDADDIGVSDNSFDGSFAGWVDSDATLRMENDQVGTRIVIVDFPSGVAPSLPSIKEILLGGGESVPSDYAGDFLNSIVIRFADPVPSGLPLRLRLKFSLVRI